MIGGIFGDIVGSVYEFNNTHDYDFELLNKWSAPTDDTFMTLAVAKALMDTSGKTDDETRSEIVKQMQDIGKRYPDGGYGGMFMFWLREKDPKPYGSFGNGSAMRVASVGWLYDTLEDTMHYAAVTSDVTHDHPEGIKGAQAVAVSIYLARSGNSKEEIKKYVEDTFGYDLSRKLSEIKKDYGFYEICQKSVPEAITAFLEGNSYIDVIRKAVSLGGDSDTIACMAGSIAEAYYGMPAEYREEALSRLDPYLRDIYHRFADTCKNYSITRRGSPLL